MINFIKYWDLSKGRMKQMEHTHHEMKRVTVSSHTSNIRHRVPVTAVGNRSQVNSNTTDRVRFVKCA